MIVVAVLITWSALGYLLHEPILAFLVEPLQQTIYYNSPGGGLALVLHLSITFGVILTIPWALYHVIRFVAPALPPRSHLWLFGVVIISTVLALLGMAVAMLVSVPAALHFLERFGGDAVQPLISTDRYLSFILLYIGGFAAFFQLPLLLVLLSQFTSLTARQLLGFERWIILGAFVVAAILTPTPDPMNQALLALPIIGLYQVGVGAVWLMKHTESKVAEADPQTRAALLVLKHRSVIDTWYEESEGQRRLFCRWTGQYDGQTREVTTVEIDGQHRLLLKSEANA
jgi:sec-independent protein translocase protein TatC